MNIVVKEDLMAEGEGFEPPKTLPP